MNEAAIVVEILETVRASLEDRFLRAGETMGSALRAVEALIQALDRLSGALEGEASAEADKALHGAAADLLALPAVQAERRSAFVALVGQSGRLASNIEDMRTVLRYLDAFGMNLKVTAAAAVEFNGFGQELSDRISVGAERLSLFAAKVGEVDDQLRHALGLVRQLEADCEQVLPSVADELQASAEAIRRHNHEINLIAGQVTELARRVRAKVGAALIAMQIGDTTRQRIEHVQAGLRLLAQPGLDEREHNTVLQLLLDQLADLTDTFGVDAQRVSENLLGLNEDACEVLRLKSLIGDGQAGGFLRDLEGKVGQANGVVDQVRAANSQAGRAGRAVVEAVKALLDNVDAIQSVKSDIRYMAINTSLRCSRMGEAGRPVNVIGMELRVGADRLGETADSTIVDLDGLAEGATRFVANETGADLVQELDQALATIRQARGGAEADLMAVAEGSAEVARVMEALSADAEFHTELDLGLNEARTALEVLTDGTLAPVDEASETLGAILAEIFRQYTMDREREVHRRHAAVEAPAPFAADEDEDQILFAGARC